MVILKTTRISINPSDSREYLWWLNHRDELVKAGFFLKEDTTVCWYASKENSYIAELEEKENER